MKQKSWINRHLPQRLRPQSPPPESSPPPKSPDPHQASTSTSTSSRPEKKVAEEAATPAAPPPPPPPPAPQSAESPSPSSSPSASPRPGLLGSVPKSKSRSRSFGEGEVDRAIRAAATAANDLVPTRGERSQSEMPPPSSSSTRGIGGRRASYAINDLKIDASTQWGEGVAVIESVLERGSATADALSPEQRRGLRDVQMLLLRHGAGGGHDSLAHIPRALLNLGNIVEDSEEDGDNAEAESSRYLLSHFGGVVERKRTVEETTASVRKVVLAHSFVKSLLGASSQNKIDTEAYFPPEWERLSPEARTKLSDMLGWESLNKWDFNVFELAELSGGNPLLLMGWAVLGSPAAQVCMSESVGNRRAVSSTEGGYGFCGEFNFSQETLCGFLRAMEAEYDGKNPYHNNIHAADVLQTVHSLLQMGGKDFAAADIQMFGILLAAVVHDVGHPGANNSYQINAKSDLALRYNDISVLENMHASRAFGLIMGDKRDRKIDVLGGMRPAQVMSVRKIVIDAVLHTDMTKHFAMVDQMKGLLVSSDEEDIQKNHSVEVLNYMLHLADVSNPAKPAPMFLDWTDRCLREFFAQGDLEKESGLPVSPLCDRDKTSKKQSQVGFITFVVEPAYEVLAKAMPALEEVVMPVIGDNLKYWKRLPDDAPAAPSGKPPTADAKEKRAKKQAKKEAAPKEPEAEDGAAEKMTERDAGEEETAENESAEKRAADKRTTEREGMEKKAEAGEKPTEDGANRESKEAEVRPQGKSVEVALKEKEEPEEKAEKQPPEGETSENGSA